MRKLFTTILCAVAAFLATTGCVKELVAHDDQDDVIVHLGIARSAASTDSEATADELAIHDVLVYIFNDKGVLENPDHIRIEANPLLQAGTDRINDSWRVRPGQKTVYVVVNGEMLMTLSGHQSIVTSNFLSPVYIGQHSLISDPVWMTQESFDAECTTNPTTNKGYVTSDELLALNHFTDCKMMSGYKTFNAIPDANGEYVVEVPVKRRYAALELHLRKGDGLANTEVLITQIKFRHMSAYGSIFETSVFDPYDCAGSVYTNMTDEVPKNRNSQYPATVSYCYLLGEGVSPAPKQLVKEGLEYTQMIVRPYSHEIEFRGPFKPNRPVTLNPNRFYMFPRSAMASKNAAAGTPMIEIEALVGGVNGVGGKAKTYTAYLSNLDTENHCDPTKPLDILGNCIYRVKATLKGDDKTEIQLDIKDWEDEAVDGDIRGTYIKGPSEVVMDWWTLGKRFDRKIHFSSDGALEVILPATARPNWLTKCNVSKSQGGKSAAIELEYAPTATGHSDYRITIKTGKIDEKTGRFVEAGKIEKTVTIVYDNGFLPGIPAAWAQQTGGAGGIHLTKRNCADPRQTQVSLESAQFKIVATNPIPAALAALKSTSSAYGTGFDNTKLILESVSDNSAYTLKGVCGSLNDAWYLPSLEEMKWIFQQQNYLGPSYRFDFASPAVGSSARFLTSTIVSDAKVNAVTLSQSSDQRDMYVATYMRLVCNVEK